MIIKKYTSLLLLLSIIGQTSAMENDSQSGENRLRSKIKHSFSRLLSRDEMPLIDLLCKALLCDDLKKAERLLERKVDPNTPNCMGITPLHLSAAIGDLNACKLLIKYGANPFLPSPALNYELPLHCALTHLIPVNEKYNQVAKYLIGECNVNPNIRGTSQASFLHQTALTGNTEMFEILLQKGIHTNTTDIFGCNVLHFAAFSFHGKTEEQSLKCIRELLCRGIDYKAKNKNGKTPAQYTNSKLVKKTLKNDSSVKQFLISETNLDEKNIYEELKKREIGIGKPMRHEKFNFEHTKTLLLGNK